MNQLPGADRPDGVTLQIAFWIDADGVITRIAYPPFAHRDPNDDLKALMVGLQLPDHPPRDMLLPLRLAIVVKPKEAPKPQAWRAPWPKPSIHVQVTYDGRGAAGKERG